MTKTIWKYSLDITDIQIVDMPEGAKPLTVQIQNGSVVMWCMVDLEAPIVKREIVVAGTGNGISERVISKMSYVGSVQIMNGRLVFHVFA